MHPIDTINSPALKEATSASPPKVLSRDAASLKQSCQDFEAIFIESMFKAMRKTIPDGGLFEKDTAHEIYQEMLDSEISKEISKHQSIGLADQMYRQMEKFLPDTDKK